MCVGLDVYLLVHSLCSCVLGVHHPHLAPSLLLEGVMGDRSPITQGVGHRWYHPHPFALRWWSAGHTRTHHHHHHHRCPSFCSCDSLLPHPTAIAIANPNLVAFCCYYGTPSSKQEHVRVLMILRVLMIMLVLMVFVLVFVPLVSPPPPPF